MNNMYHKIDHKVNQLFDFYAILPVKEFDSLIVDRWREWIDSSFHGAMGYMERERGDLRRIMSSAQSVVVVALAQPERRESSVARCFSGERDYHDRVKERLWELLAYIKQLDSSIKGRAVVDSAPIFEKALAASGGLGWIGRNSLLVTKAGSYFNLGLLLLNVNLPEHRGSCLGDHCGSCRRCIESCPTGSIGEDRMIDSRRCISYLNMEAVRLGTSTPIEGSLYGWDRGCDSCQMCCPWNREG